MKNLLHQIIKNNYFFFVTFLLPYLSYSQPQTRFEYSFGKLGTVCQVIFYAQDSATAQKAIHHIYLQIDSLNGILSDYDENSEIRKLCAQASENQEIKVSKTLYEVIGKSVALSKVTKGTFDITVGNYVLLWRRARRQHIFPTKTQLRKAKKMVGYQKIKLIPDRQAVLLKAKEMRLDVGAIGKGYIADQILESLRTKFGITSALIDLGGDISMGDAPPDKTGWTIQVGTQTVTLANCAIATSGDTFQYVTFAGKRYSHLVHPKTGLGLVNALQVTVIAPDGTTADALASALSVMGKKKGEKWLRKNKERWGNLQVIFR
jgi:FAD:protein FMN transferase